MANLNELRQKYPQYNDMSDQEFADKFHTKYYSDIPKNDFYSKLGLSSESDNLQKQHPYLYEAAKALQGFPGVEQAGNIAGKFNNIIEQTGLPSAAKGFLGTGVEMGRGLTNLIPGVHIPQQQYPELFVNPTYGKTVELGGGLGMGLPLIKGVQAAKYGIEALPYGKNIPSLIKNALAGGAIGSAVSPDFRKTGAVIGSGSELLPAATQGIKNIYERIKEPTRLLNESKETLQNIKHLLSEQKEMGQTEKTGLNQFLNNVQEGLTGKQAELESKLPELFPIKPKSETRLNLNTAIKDNINNLTENFNKRYLDFNIEHGKMPVKTPFEWHDINLDNIPHVSMTTRKMGYNVSNDKLHYQDSAGDTVTINFPPDMATVKDYVDFGRELRDAAWDATKAAKTATYGEAKSLRKTSKYLRQLQGQAEDKIKNTVGEQAYQGYRKIQEDYGNLMGPVKTEPALFNAAYKKKISDKLHDTLLQPANEHIRNHLYKSPEFINSLREHLLQGPKHPLSKGPMINPASIDSDLELLLTPEQKSAKAEQLQLHKAQEHLNEVSGNIKNPEILTTQQEQRTRAFHPITSEHLSNEAQRRHIINELERQQSEHNITKEELQRKIKGRRALATGVGAGLAVTQGHNLANLIKGLF